MVFFLIPKVGSESDELAVEFIKSIRQIDWLSTAYIVYICESNTGQEAFRHGERVSRLYRVLVVSEISGRVGVWTTNERKAMYGAYGQAALDNDALSLLDKFACVSPDPDERRETLRIMLIEQLSCTSTVQTRSTNDMSHIKVSWSGKRNGRNDDLVMGFVGAEYHGKNLVKGDYIDYLPRSIIYGS